MYKHGFADWCAVGGTDAALHTTGVLWRLYSK